MTDAAQIDQMRSNSPSRRPRTPDVWWPDCGNYEPPFNPTGRDHLRSRTFERSHHISPQEQFCNRVQWATEDFLESVNYPLIDEWHRPIYSFGRDGEVTAATDDPYRVSAYLGDPKWLSGEYFRRLWDALFKDPRWRQYYVQFGSLYSESTAILNNAGLTLDGAMIVEQRWNDRVEEWMRRLALQQEAREGTTRSAPAHIKQLLPGLKHANHTKPWLPIFVQQSNDTALVWFHAPPNLADWKLPNEIIADDMGPDVNDAGLLSPAFMYRKDAAGKVYCAELSDSAERFRELTFDSAETLQKHIVQIDIETAITDAELSQRYPPQTN